MFYPFKIKVSVIDSLRNSTGSLTGDAQKEQEAKDRRKNQLRKYLLTTDGIIDGKSLKELWFPQGEYQIFLSHSSQDVDKARYLKRWFDKNCGLKCFIDADVWENAYELLRELDNTIYECLINAIDPHKAIIPTETKNLDVLPSHIDLVGAEIEMLNLEDREKIMRKLLDPIRNEYDYILIDCSPSLGLITVNALTAANSVIIPVQCEYFALEGISKLLNTIKIIKNKLNPKLEIEGFLLTMYDSRLRLANQIYDEVKRHFQELVFKTVIQRNVKLSESPSHGLPVILYDADSTGSKNHLSLAKEIILKNK